MNVKTNIFFTLVGYLFVCCIHGKTLQYKIGRLQNSDPACLAIQFASEMDSSKELRIHLPLGIKEARFTAHKDLAIQQLSKDPSILSIIGPGGKPFSLNAQFCLSNPYKLIDWPLLEKDFLVFEVGTVLPIPQDESNQKWHIHLELMDFPKDFIFASSFASGTKEINIRETISSFKNSIIVGGTDATLENIRINEKSVGILKRGSFNNLLSLNPFIEKIINHQRNFWPDHDFPHYLVVLQEHPCQGVNSYANGRHYNNALVAQLPSCYFEKSLPTRVKWILSHEFFHAWMAFKIKFDLQDMPSLLWFIEGFNDYYGLLLAFQSGLISYKEYIKQYNELIRYYYQLPINNIPNKQIVTQLGKDPDYRVLAQLRGHFMAKEMAIWLNKNGSSLDSLMKEIYSTYKRTNVPLKKEQILEVFQQYLDAAQWQTFLQHIEQGIPFSFSDRALGVFAKKTYQPIEVPDAEFDRKALIEDHVIKGLKINSRGCQAGLREGQQIASYKISLIDTKVEAFLWASDNNSFKEIHFLPATQKIIIPQYVMIEGKTHH